MYSGGESLIIDRSQVGLGCDEENGKNENQSDKYEVDVKREMFIS